MDMGKEMKKLIKKEIIKFLKSIKTDDKEKINNVIKFLEQGWKYKQMWKELEKRTKKNLIFYKGTSPSCNQDYINTLDAFLDSMIFLKQEYFPNKFDKIKKGEN